MGYKVVAAADVEAMHGVFRPIRRALGVTAFGLNQEEWPADSAGHPEHDEAKSGQEEVYYVLEGSGRIAVGGDDVELSPGMYVFIEPGTSRQLLAGPDGIKVICIGSVPGTGYPVPE